MHWVSSLGFPTPGVHPQDQPSQNPAQFTRTVCANEVSPLHTHTTEEWNWMTHYPRPRGTWTDKWKNKPRAQDTPGEAASQAPGKTRRIGKSVSTVNPPSATSN